MSKQVNPTLIGAFVIGALIILTTAIILFGGDTFFNKQESVVMYFGGSVDGLDVGAPVTVRGVEIGVVTAINIQFNTETGEMRIPVIANINAASINQARQLNVDDPLKAIIENLGLRAQLKIQSLLTSQLFIELDYHPHTEIHYHGDDSMLEIPTIPMPMEQLGRALNDISLEQMMTEIASSIRAINKLVNSPEVMETVVNMKNAFASVESLSIELNEKIVPLANNTNETMTQIRTTLFELKPTLENLKNLTNEDSPYVQGLDLALQDIAAAAQTVRDLQDLPQMQKLDVALDEITEAARIIATLEDSPQMVNLNTAMEELASASRTVRILADAIERQPEILLKGKNLEQ